MALGGGRGTRAILRGLRPALPETRTARPLRRLRQTRAPLLDANIPAARLVCASGTQWRVGFGGPYGLDYPAVFAVARALGITMDADTLNGVALIERTQLELWNREKH